MCLRNDFDTQIRETIRICRALGYHPTYLEQMINANHPVDVAKRLVISANFQHGIRELTRKGRQELTIEGIMQQERFSPLFSQSEIDAAAWRLQNVPQE